VLPATNHLDITTPGLVGEEGASGTGARVALIGRHLEMKPLMTRGALMYSWGMRVEVRGGDTGVGVTPIDLFAVPRGEVRGTGCLHWFWNLPGQMMPLVQLHCNQADSCRSASLQCRSLL
jgi:hypothetical protein